MTWITEYGNCVWHPSAAILSLACNAQPMRQYVPIFQEMRLEVIWPGYVEVISLMYYFLFYQYLYPGLL